MNISQHIEQLNKRYTGGISKEHAYRGDLRITYKILSNGYKSYQRAYECLGIWKF